MAVLRVSTCAAPASTVTCSLTAPTCRLTLKVGLLSTCNTIPVCTFLLKPSFVISTMYGPIGRSGRAKFPSAPVAAMRTTPVAVCVALMAAPGMADPLGSLTVPLICDVWAHIATDVKKRPKTILVIVFITVPLPEPTGRSQPGIAAGGQVACASPTGQSLNGYQSRRDDFYRLIKAHPF